MPRKANKQKVPSSIPLLHSDLWQLIFPYLRGEDIVNTCQAIKGLKEKLDKESKLKGFQSLIPSHYRVSNGFFEINRNKLDTAEISVSNFIFLARNYNSCESKLLADFLYQFYDKCVLNRDIHTMSRIEVLHIPHLMKNFKSADILSICDGGVRVSYYVYEKAKKLYVQKIHYNTLPTFAFSFLKQKNITTKEKLDLYYPNINFEAICIRMKDDKITHDKTDNSFTFIFGDKTDEIKPICGLQLHVK